MNSSATSLKFGMIGCGALGVVHAARLSSLPGVEVVAVSDPSHDAMLALAAQINSRNPLTMYSEYQEMLTAGSLDAVCISSPNRWHVEQLLASLESGLHVLCEKPLSLSPEEVSQVVEATNRSGKTVAIAYQSRYRLDSRRLRRALRSGKWGKITSVSLYSSEDWITSNVGTWRHDPARCPGGFFADANGHQLDLLFWLTDTEAANIHANIETRGTPVPMMTWGQARLIHQGGHASMESSSAPPLTFHFVGDARRWREEIVIHTERADFVMRDTRLLWSDGSEPLTPFPESALGSPDSDMPDLPDTAFVWAVQNGQPVLSPPETVWPVLNFTRAALADAGFPLD